MTPEIYWMTLTVLLTAVLWLPYVLDRMVVRGLWPAFAGTVPEASRSLWAQRATRAHENAVENLVVFVPAVLTAHALGISTPATRAAAAVYFFARLTHVLVYTAGVPVARTLAFTAGWLAQIVILASILRWI